MVTKVEDPEIARNIDALEGKLSMLSAAGMIGLDRQSGAYLSIQYSTKYQCKGGMNSESWNVSCYNIANAYCDSGNKDPNNIKTARGVVAKCMYDMSKCMSKTRDESQYILCGGKLTRNSYGTPAKCSINEVSLEEIVSDTVKVVSSLLFVEKP